MSKKQEFSFPCWLYHKTHGAVLFTSQDDFAGAGEGWKDSPAKFEKLADKKFDKPVSKMSKLELIAACRSISLSEEKFQGKPNEEIMALLNEEGYE